MGQPIVIPNTNVANQLLRSLGDGQSTTVWSATGNTLRLAATYIGPGTLSLPSGSTNYIPPLIVPVPSGQTVNFVGVAGFLRDGSSVQMNITQTGVTVPGLSGITVTTAMTAFYLPTSVSVANLDYFSPVYTVLNGTPGNLALAFVFDVTA